MINPRLDAIPPATIGPISASDKRPRPPVNSALEPTATTRTHGSPAPPGNSPCPTCQGGGMGFLTPFFHREPFLAVVRNALQRLMLIDPEKQSHSKRGGEAGSAAMFDHIALRFSGVSRLAGGAWRRGVLPGVGMAAMLNGGTLEGGEIEALVLGGAPVSGIPNLPELTSAYRMDVNNAGVWVARVTRTNGDVVLKQGGILVDNNSPEVTSNSIFSMSINNKGDAVSMVYREDAKVGDFSNGTQVYFNDRVLATPGQPIAVAELPVGTVYRSIYDAVINDLNQVFIVAIAVSPPNQSFQLMVRLDLDGAGQVTGGALVYRDGHQSTLPAGSIYNPPRSSWEWDANNLGQVIHYATVFLKSGGSNQTLFRNFERLYEEDVASPVPGRTGKYVQASHLNDHGSWAAQVGFSEGHIRAQMIVRDGEKVVELGDLLPAGGTVTEFCEPLFLDNDGDVFWLGRWKRADNSFGTGLFLNDGLLVESDVSQFRGMPLRINTGGTGGTFSVSDNGEFVIFGAHWSGRAGLFRIRIPSEVSLAIEQTAEAGQAMRLSCHPRVDVSRVQLFESEDLVSWRPAAGENGVAVSRPVSGWAGASLEWEVQAGTGLRYFRVVGLKD